MKYRSSGPSTTRKRCIAYGIGGISATLLICIFVSIRSYPYETSVSDSLNALMEKNSYSLRVEKLHRNSFSKEPFSLWARKLFHSGAGDQDPRTGRGVPYTYSNIREYETAAGETLEIRIDVSGGRAYRVFVSGKAPQRLLREIANRCAALRCPLV